MAGPYRYVGDEPRLIKLDGIELLAPLLATANAAATRAESAASSIGSVSAAVVAPFQPNSTFAGAINRTRFRGFLVDADLSGWTGYDPSKFYSFGEIYKDANGTNSILYVADGVNGENLRPTGIEFAADTSRGYNANGRDVFVIKHALHTDDNPVQIAIVPAALPNNYYGGANYTQSGIDDHVFRRGYGVLLRSLEKPAAGTTIDPRLVVPSKVHALVGTETSLYYDAMALLPEVGNGEPSYLFDVVCDIGAHTRRCYRVTPTADQVGSYPLTVKVYDNTGAVIATASTTLVVLAAQNPSTVKRVLGVADSTWDDTGEMPKTLQQNLAALPGSDPLFVGTHGTAPYNFEARSGQTLSYFANGAARTRLTVTGFPAVPFWPILTVYGTDGAGLALLYDEIHVSGGSGTITGLISGALAQRVVPGWTGQLRIDGYNQTFNVTAVEALTGYSPFKDGNGTGALNFANYASRNSLAAADLLVIELGINDSRGDVQAEAVQQAKIADAKKLTAAFLAWRSSGKVMICLPKSCASTRAEAARHDAYRLNIHRFRELIVQAFDNGAYDARVYVAATGLMIDRFYGYTMTTPVVGARFTETQVFHPDQVHPRAEGYRQLADAMAPAVLAGLI